VSFTIITNNTGSFAELYKERFFDVGIAEQHAVTFAGGLSAKGMVPVFAVYSTFLQRAYSLGKFFQVYSSL